MRNPKLVLYETIVRATSGEPEAVDEVLQHYGKQIRLASLENGHVNKDTEDNIKRRLIAALFQFHFDYTSLICFQGPCTGIKRAKWKTSYEAAVFNCGKGQ